MDSLHYIKFLPTQFLIKNDKYDVQEQFIVTLLIFQFGEQGMNLQNILRITRTVGVAG